MVSPATHPGRLHALPAAFAALLAAVCVLPGPARADTAIGGIRIDNAGGAVCSMPDRPAGATSLWTCQVPNGSGGVATVSGVASGPGGYPDTAALASWVGTRLGANAIALGNAGTSAIGPGAIAIGAGAQATQANSVAIGAGATASTPDSVALGAGSTTSAATPTAGTTLRGTDYGFAGSNPAGVLSVGSAGAERQIQHVAAGQLSATSTDAVNGSQLFATNQALNNLAVTAGAGINVSTAATGTGIALGTSVANVGPGGTVTYTAGNNMVLTQAGAATTFAVNDNPGFASVKVGSTRITADGVRIANGPSMTASGIDAGGQTIANVAPGVEGTDAVNVNQLRAGLGTVSNNVNALRQEVADNRRDAQAGVAGAMAMAGMPQAYLPGRSMVAAAAATFKGQTAIAVGLSKISDNGRWVTKLTGSANTRGDVGVTVGAGYQW